MERMIHIQRAEGVNSERPAGLRSADVHGQDM